jgi:hypothetical protein
LMRACYGEESPAVTRADEAARALQRLRWELKRANCRSAPQRRKRLLVIEGSVRRDVSPLSAARLRMYLFTKPGFHGFRLGPIGFMPWIKRAHEMYSKICPDCLRSTMQIVQSGEVQCSECGLQQ